MSSYSNGDGGNCVEVGAGGFPVIPVRDSKDVSRGHIDVHRTSWAVLIGNLKTGTRPVG